MRIPPRLSSVPRAYLTGRCASLKPPAPHRAYHLREQLAAASPEVVAAFELGRAADPRLPMPAAGEVLAAVVARMARQSVEELGGEA